MTRLLRDNEIEVVAAVIDGDALVREVVARRPDLAVGVAGVGFEGFAGTAHAA